MGRRIVIEGQGGAFGAHIARPAALPAPAVVVLHELFGVNADIRKTCDELVARVSLRLRPICSGGRSPASTSMLGLSSIGSMAFACIRLTIGTRARGTSETLPRLRPSCPTAPARSPSLAIASEG